MCGAISAQAAFSFPQISLMNATRILTLSVLMIALIAWTLSEEAKAINENNSDIAETYATFLDEITEYWLSKPDEFGRADLDWIADRFDSRFNRYIAPINLKETSDNTLIHLHKATRTLLFYTQDREKSLLLSRLSQEIMDRNLEGALHQGQAHRKPLPQDTYNALIDARLVSEADQWASRYPEDTETIDARFEFQDSSNNGDASFIITIDTSNDTTALRREKIDLDDGKWIVGILHPNCRFSRKAMEALSTTETMRSLTDNWDYLWLADQQDLTPIDTLADWNRNAEFFELSVPYQKKTWPRSVDFSETPVFYFIKDGEVINELRGWPSDGQKELFKEAVRGADTP